MGDYAVSSNPAHPMETTPCPILPKLNRRELSAHLRLSLRTIDNLLKSGTLPYFKVGKAIRFDPAEVESAMRRKFHVQAKNQ
jgi:excisionase family DNA binding protein